MSICWADEVEKEETSQSESEESSNDEAVPATEESLVALLTEIILSEKYMDHCCSCSIERVVEILSRRAKGLLENVLGCKKSFTLSKFLKGHGKFVVIEQSRTLNCGRVETLIKVAIEGTDYQRGDYLLQQYEEGRFSHIINSLIKAIEKEGTLTIDEFIGQYKKSTLALDIYYYLPKRGDLVRLLNKQRGIFWLSNPTKDKVVITKKTQTRQNRSERKWNRQASQGFHNSYYHC